MTWRKLMNWLRRFLMKSQTSVKELSLDPTSKSVEIQLKIRVIPAESHALVSVLDLSGQWCSALCPVEMWNGGYNIFVNSTDFKPRKPRIFGTMESMMLKFSDHMESRQE